MSFILSENTTRRELLEPDNYAARCYGLVIIGTKFNQQPRLIMEEKPITDVHS